MSPAPQRAAGPAVAAGGRRALAPATVLGAWGRGVFGKDPTVVAGAFSAAPGQVGYFEHVVFAVLDRVPTTPTHRALLDLLPPPAGSAP